MAKLITEFMPSRQPGSRRLMIVLHGLGDSTAGYHWLPSALNLPWLNYQLVNAPDDYYGGYSWFDIQGEMRPGIDRSRRLLTELLTENESKGFPAAETVIFGFSQGCLMTLETGLRHPHRFAGLVGISGFLPHFEQVLRELSPVAREQRVLVTHGTRDPLLAFDDVKSQMAALQKAGIQLKWLEYPKVHTIHGDVELGDIRAFVESCFAPRPV